MTGLAPWTVWVVAGAALLVAEAALPGIFLMWLGLAGIGTGLLTCAAGLGMGGEVAAFAGLAALSIGVGLRARRARAPVLNTPQSGLVGRHATALAFSGPEGRVRLGDTDWAARFADGPDCLPGTKVRVTAVEGTVLVVRRLHAEGEGRSV